MIYQWGCNSCGRDTEVTRPIADHSMPPEEYCECGMLDWKRIYSAPMLMNASFLDGTKRTGFSEMKEAARLKVDMADTPHNKRAGIAAEIRKLESIKK